MANPEFKVPKLSAQQIAVLLDALEAAKSSGNAENWYHRGQFGFGISQSTAASLERKGLVNQRVWERFYRPTQYVQLTLQGYNVALKLKVKTARPEGQ